MATGSTISGAYSCFRHGLIIMLVLDSTRIARHRSARDWQRKRGQQPMEGEIFVILAGVVILAAAAGANYCVARSWLYPPVLFCSWWSFILLVLLVSSGLFHPVGSDSIVLFVIGALAYSTGALFAWPMPSSSPNRPFETDANESRIGKVYLAIFSSIIVTLPLFALHMFTLATGAPSDSFWTAMRRAAMEQSNLPGGGGLVSIGSLAPLYLILSYIAVYELTFSPRYRRTLLTLVGLTFVFQLLTTARSSIAELIVGAIAILAIRRGRPPIRVTLVLVILFLLVFGLNQFLLKKMEADWTAPANERVVKILRGVAVYSAGSLVAFDDVMKHPGHVRNTWKIYKPFVRIANKFDAGLPVLSQHLEETNIGSGLAINTYTFYFTYYVDFGIIGVVCAAMLFGLVSTIVYRMARSNNPIGIIWYALVVYGIVMSTFAECVFLEITLWMKAFICVFLMYKLLPLAGRSSPCCAKHRDFYLHSDH